MAPKNTTKKVNVGALANQLNSLDADTFLSVVLDKADRKHIDIMATRLYGEYPLLADFSPRETRDAVSNILSRLTPEEQHALVRRNPALLDLVEKQSEELQLAAIEGTKPEDWGRLINSDAFVKPSARVLRALFNEFRETEMMEDFIAFLKADKHSMQVIESDKYLKEQWALAKLETFD